MKETRIQHDTIGRQSLADSCCHHRSLTLHGTTQRVASFLGSYVIVLYRIVLTLHWIEL